MDDAGTAANLSPHSHDVTVTPHLSDAAGGRTQDDLEAALQCPECGLRLLGLLVTSPSWVYRRVESVSFRDHRTVRRRVSVDFSVPVSAPVLRIGTHPYGLVPLTVMRRKTLVNFDLRDESDRSIPLLNVRQNQAATRALVRTWAAKILESEELPPDVERFVEQLVAGRQEDLLAAGKEAHGPDAPPVLQRLVNDERFRVVMDRLTEDFVLFVLVPDDKATRRVLKFRYDEKLTLRYRKTGYDPKDGTYEPVDDPLPLWSPSRLLAALGWRPTRIRFPTPAAENCRSYHFEVHAPPGVEIASASLLAGRPNDPSPDPQPPSFDIVGGGFPTVDLHAVDVPRGSLSRAQVDLHVTPHPWLTLAVISAWATATTLFWAAAGLGEPAGRDNSTATTLFVAFTAAVSAVLWRPSEHRMALRLLSVVGALTTTASALLVTAAALLAFDGDSHLGGPLAALGLGATAIAAVISVTWVQASRALGQTQLSPWEQGSRIDIDEASMRDRGTFESALSTYGYDAPAIRVASAESGYARRASVDADTPASTIPTDAILRGLHELLAEELARLQPKHRSNTSPVHG